MEAPSMDWVIVTGPPVKCKYFKYVHLSIELDLIFWRIFVN